MSIEHNSGSIISDPRTRKTAYHVIAAGLAVAAVWGFVTAEQIEQYLPAVIALLGIAGPEMAAANVGEQQAGPDDVDLGDEYPGGEMMEGAEDYSGDQPIDGEPVR